MPIWNALVHHWAVSITLNMFINTLTGVSIADLHPFVPVHWPLRETLDLLTASLCIFIRFQVDEAISKVTSFREVDGNIDKVHEVTKAFVNHYIQ